MAPEVVGRDEELAVVAAFVHGALDGPTAFVLEGEAGIGKSTLWQAGVDRARSEGLRVLAVRPAEAELGLGHAGLGDLVEGWSTRFSRPSPFRGGGRSRQRCCGMLRRAGRRPCARRRRARRAPAARQGRAVGRGDRRRPVARSADRRDPRVRAPQAGGGSGPRAARPEGWRGGPAGRAGARRRPGAGEPVANRAPERRRAAPRVARPARPALRPPDLAADP